MREYKVSASFDDESKVWYVSESEVPGLATCAPTLDELMERVKAIAPELIELNSHIVGSFKLEVNAQTSMMLA